MDVFGYGTDEPSRPLLPPGLCWICDNSPTQSAEKVIDTRRNSRPGPHAIHTTERKYVCGGCATDLGKAVGMVPGDDLRAVARDLHAAEDRAAHLAADLAAARESQTRVVPADDIAALVRAEVAKLKPKPAAKASVPASK